MRKKPDFTPRNADYRSYTPETAVVPSNEPCDCGGKGMFVGATRLYCQWCGKSLFELVAGGLIAVQPRNVTP